MRGGPWEMSLFFLNKNDPKLTSSGPFAPFSFGHFVILVLAFVLICLMLRAARRRPRRTRRRWLYTGYGVMILLNTARLVWELSVDEFSWQQSLPLQLCGIQMFLIPIALFGKGKTSSFVRECVFAYGIVGFVLALLVPFTTLFHYPLMHFRSLQSFAYHTTLGFVCLMLPQTGFAPHVKNANKAFAVLMASAAATSLLNFLIGSNYLYTARLPLPTQPIPWPYYIPLLGGFMFLLGRVPYHIAAAVQNKTLSKHKNMPSH